MIMVSVHVCDAGEDDFKGPLARLASGFPLQFTSGLNRCMFWAATVSSDMNKTRRVVQPLQRPEAR